MLLEITPIVKSDDVHEVVGLIQQKSQQILTAELHLDPRPHSRENFEKLIAALKQNSIPPTVGPHWRCASASMPI